jgi:hypothetical protein
MDYKHDDPLDPARGMINGAIFGILLWIAIGLVVLVFVKGPWIFQ